MAPLVDPREKAEKGRSSLSTPGDCFAYWPSQISSPFVVGLGVFGYIALSTASTVTEGFQWLTVIGVGLLVPFGSIWWGVITEKLTDIHVSRRSECLVPLVVGLLSLGGMLAGLLLLSASRPLVATLAAVIVSFALATGPVAQNHQMVFFPHTRRRDFRMGLVGFLSAGFSPVR